MTCVGANFVGVRILWILFFLFVVLFQYHGKSTCFTTIWGNIVFIVSKHRTCKFKFEMVGFSYTWKAKCTIFKAIVAGFRGKVASKKIGHLAFQVDDLMILRSQ